MSKKKVYSSIVTTEGWVNASRYVQLMRWLGLDREGLARAALGHNRLFIHITALLGTLLFELIDDLRELFVGYAVQLRVDRCFNRHQLLITRLGKVIVGSESFEEGTERSTHPGRGGLVATSFLISKGDLRVSICCFRMVKS